MAVPDSIGTDTASIIIITNVVMYFFMTDLTQKESVEAPFLAAHG